METSRVRIARVVHADAARDARAGSWATQLRWFAAAVAVGFAVPFLGSSVLDLHHDLYLAVYFASVLALVAAYVRTTELDVRQVLSRNWELGAVLGLILGIALVRNVLADDATPRPHGAYFRLRADLARWHLRRG